VTSAIAGLLLADGVHDEQVARDLELLRSGDLPLSGCNGTLLAEGSARLTGDDTVIDGALETAEARRAPDGGVLRRDALGVRPLYYATSPDGRRLAFASRWEQLDRLDWVDHAIDEEGLCDTFFDLGSDPTRTCVSGIKKVPHGHRLEWRNGAVALVRDWSAEDFLWSKGRGPRDAPAEFAERLVEAVRRRCQPETAILMSGGLDSTSIAAAAVRAGLRPRTLSASYPGSPNVDESDQIRATKAALGLAGDLVTVDDAGLATVDEELRIHGRPTGAPNYSNFLALMDEASRLGYERLLDGHDGDSALGLPKGLAAHLVTRPRLAGEFLLAARRAGRSPALLARSWVADLAPPALYRVRDALRIRPRAKAADRPAWIPEPVADRLSSPDSMTWREFQSTAASAHLASSFETVGRLAGSRGIEILHPYADRELIEFLLGLPPEAKHAGGQSKSLVRRGFPELPESVLGQRKLTFTDTASARHPFDEIARSLRERCADLPGVDYDVLERRLAEGPPYRPSELSCMRWLVVSHAFLARRAVASP
jgi:asparagine synthase (glutamine-hydrolysing)